MSNVPNTYAQLGFNYVAELTYADIAAAATTKVVDLFPIPADGIVEKVGFYVPEFFDGGATTSLTLQLGVTGDDPDGFVAATVIHVDGTEISSAINSGAFFVGTDSGADTTANVVNAKVYDAASATTLSALFTATGGNTEVLTQGKVIVFAKIVDFAKIS